MELLQEVIFWLYLTGSIAAMIHTMRYAFDKGHPLFASTIVTLLMGVGYIVVYPLAFASAYWAYR